MINDSLMEYKGYQGTIEVSLEDDCVFGKVLHINDLVTYESDTPRKIEASFHQAVDEYIEFCKQEGKSPDRPFKGTFNIRIGQDLHREATMLAVKIGLTLNDFIKETIRDRVCRGHANASTIVHNHQYTVQTGFTTSYTEEEQPWIQTQQSQISDTLQ